MGNTRLGVSRALIGALWVGLGALVTGPIALAQQVEAAAETGGAIEEIVVTAQKRTPKPSAPYLGAIARKNGL